MSNSKSSGFAWSRTWNVLALFALWIMPCVALAAESDPLEADAPGAGNPAEDVDIPFRINAPRKEGNAFVDTDAEEIVIPSAAARKNDQLGYGYFLMELSDKALAATEAKDYPRAIKLYRALAKAVPERATAWSNLCHLYRITNQLAAAETACRDAIKLPGTTVADHTNFVELFLINHPGTVPPLVLTELDRVIGNVAKRPEAAVDAARSACLLATRLNDAKRLKACSGVLNAQLPHDPQSVSYSWALAVAEGDTDAVERELERGQAIGMPAEALATMRERGQKLLDATRSKQWRSWGMIAAGAMALVGFALFFVLRRRALAHA